MATNEETFTLLSRRRFLHSLAATAAIGEFATEVQSSEGQPALLPLDPPADRNATREVRSVLSYLRQQTGKTMLSGQTDYPDLQWVVQQTGKSPAILNLDFMRYTTQMGKETADTQRAIDWWHQQHGLVSFQWHWVSPQGAKNKGSGFYTKETTFDLATALKDPHSATYQALVSDIDDIAVELKKMDAAKVPVLFRPLHEAQGRWFWWGASGAMPCVALYHLIFDRMTKHHKLHHLIWVWTAYPDHAGKGKAIDWYPGNKWVDIIASDYLQEPKDFQALAQLGGGKKIVALAETMNPPDPDKAIEAGMSWAYWVAWARRDWNGKSGEDMKSAIANPHSITLERLPDFKGVKR